jgi:hypothetical protein
MTCIEVDPLIVRQALEDLGIHAPVQAAYRKGDAVVIRTREGTHTLPLAVSGGDDTLPKATALDDFTAIDGVGSVTAEKLHAKSLYTYDDLREWLAQRRRAAVEDDEIRDYTVEKIRAWLDARLV